MSLILKFAQADFDVWWFRAADVSAALVTAAWGLFNDNVFYFVAGLACLIASLFKVNIWLLRLHQRCILEALKR